MDNIANKETVINTVTKWFLVFSYNLLHNLFLIIALFVWADDLFATATDFFLDEEVARFWTVTSDRLVPRGELALWVAITAIEDTIALSFALDDLSFVTQRTSHADFFGDSFGVVAFWKVATSVEFAVAS